MKFSYLSAIILAATVFTAQATEPVQQGQRLEYGASMTVNGSSGDFAPYMIGSWQGGRYTQKSGMALGISAKVDLDTARRFSWGAGAEGIATLASDAVYARYSAENKDWYDHRTGPNIARLQQLWGALKYRGVYLLVGMKERQSQIVDETLSSGDLTRSNNARPIPGVAAGFHRFQNIPLTNGWVQIDGEIMYGKFFDSDATRSRYNYYNYILATDLYYTYKRCYFRTKPTQPFFITVGMQTAGLFGGMTEYYYGGVLDKNRTVVRGFHIKDIWQMFFPMEGGEDFYKGSSLGSWDFRADLRLRNGRSLAFYFEWPWEDGSGIGRRNGWDGVWGFEVNLSKQAPVEKIVVEYLDFTNQSGPIHWAPGDYPGTDLTSHASGADNYYNNDYYGPYSNFGMSIGTPFLVSPLYNQDGYEAFAHNRARGFHAAVKGHIVPDVSYRAMVGSQWAWGQGRRPVAKCLNCTSAMMECHWDAHSVMPGIDVRAQLAFDAGGLRGTNFGALVSVSYTGLFNFKK